MSFEKKSLCIVVPLDPTKGPCYIEPVHDYKSDENLDQIYKITVRDQDWVNLAADGCIAWDHEISCTTYSNKELEHWENRLHEVCTLRCNMMTKLLHCVSSKVRNLPYYNGLTNIDKFLDAFERKVFEKHLFQVLDLALRTMSARWWSMHKGNFNR